MPKYRCKKDLVMDSGKVDALAGKIYVFKEFEYHGIELYSFVDENGGGHWMDKEGMAKYFELVDPIDTTQAIHVEDDGEG